MQPSHHRLHVAAEGAKQSPPILLCHVLSPYNTEPEHSGAKSQWRIGGAWGEGGGGRDNGSQKVNQIGGITNLTQMSRGQMPHLLAAVVLKHPCRGFAQGRAARRLLGVFAQ